MTTALESFSAALSESIATVGRSIVAVRGRHSSGTGIHWRSGSIVTSCEAINTEDGLNLVLPDGQSVSTQLLGSDPTTDVAILALPEGVDMPLAPLGDPEALALGQLVMTVGQAASMGDRGGMDRGGMKGRNRRRDRRGYQSDRSSASSSEMPATETSATETPAENLPEEALRQQPFSSFASVGIVSQIGGAWRSQAGGQIDQRIVVSLGLRRGSAGCPLIDAGGRVVGFNTFGPRRSVLSIPATNVNRLLDQLQQRGKISRGYLGLGMQRVPLPDNVRQQHGLTQMAGIMVVSVELESAADLAGMVLGDVMVAVDEAPLESLQQVQALLTPQSVGQTLRVTLLRAGNLQTADVTVGER